MRYKAVPEPRSVEFLESARAALALVPGSVEDCCTRIRDATDCRSRDEAREVLTFLQALGLAAETDRGFRRTRADLDDDELAADFRENVFGAREVLEALDDGATTVDDVVHDTRDDAPRWERERNAEWEDAWRERTERLLAWAVEFGILECDGPVYRLSDQVD